MSIVSIPNVENVTKDRPISFNEKVISEFLMNHVVYVNHVVLRESRSFSQKNKDSYVVSTGAA